MFFFVFFSAARRDSGVPLNIRFRGHDDGFSNKIPPVYSLKYPYSYILSISDSKFLLLLVLILSVLSLVSVISLSLLVLI